MGRNLTHEQAELTGAWEKDPQRRRPKPPKSNNPLGKCPDYLNAQEKKCWRELVAYAIPGTLTEADRWICETACVLMARLRSDSAGCNATQITALVNTIGRLGMTPVDRARLGGAPPEDKQKSPFSEFIN